MPSKALLLHLSFQILFIYPTDSSSTVILFKLYKVSHCLNAFYAITNLQKYNILFYRLFLYYLNKWFFFLLTLIISALRHTCFCLTLFNNRVLSCCLVSRHSFIINKRTHLKHCSLVECLLDYSTHKYIYNIIMF